MRINYICTKYGFCEDDNAILLDTRYFIHNNYYVNLIKCFCPSD